MIGEYARDIPMCEYKKSEYCELNIDTFVDNSNLYFYNNVIPIPELSDMVIECPHFELDDTYYTMYEYKIMFRCFNIKTPYCDLCKEEQENIKQKLINILRNDFLKIYDIREYLINGGYNVNYMCRGVYKRKI